MKRAGLIVNPQSGKSSGKGLRLMEMVRSKPNISARLLERFEQLPNHLNELARDGVTDLFISSGDGTIHAIQTELAERKPFRNLPRLSLLPHGTTNMTAADLGFRHHSIADQAEFMTNLAASHLRERPTLRVVNPNDGRPRHGMFLGAGATTSAARFCQQALNTKGVKGNLATFATLAVAIGQVAFGSSHPYEVARFDQPCPMRISIGTTDICNGAQLLMLSTTLEKLTLGTRPFWGGKSGSLRTTILPFPVPSLVRWLLPIMYGRETRKVPEGSLSFASQGFDITSPGTYIIDGEFFDGPEGAPLKVETGPVFTYLCG